MAQIIDSDRFVNKPRWALWQRLGKSESHMEFPLYIRATFVSKAM